jgi:hypothetical protein
LFLIHGFYFFLDKLIYIFINQFFLGLFLDWNHGGSCDGGEGDMGFVTSK